MKISTTLKVGIYFIFVCLSINIVFSLDQPVYKSDIETGGGYLVDGWDSLPFKHQKANLSWVQYVNSEPTLSPDPAWSESNYDTKNEKIAPKCLSYAAATMNDWFSIKTGKILGQYQNFINKNSSNKN